MTIMKFDEPIEGEMLCVKADELPFYSTRDYAVIAIVEEEWPEVVTTNKDVPEPNYGTLHVSESTAMTRRGTKFIVAATKEQTLQKLHDAAQDATRRYNESYDESVKAKRALSEMQEKMNLVTKDRDQVAERLRQAREKADKVAELEQKLDRCKEELGAATFRKLFGK